MRYNLQCVRVRKGDMGKDSVSISALQVYGRRSDSYAGDEDLGGVTLIVEAISGRLSLAGVLFASDA